MATTPGNLFEDLKDALKEFKEFLDGAVNIIKPALATLNDLVPQISELLDKLVGLMGKLKTEIQNLNLDIPGLGEVTQFTGQMTNFLGAMKTLLPNEADEIDSVLEVANLVTDLPSLDQVKAEILGLVDAITAHLNTLKAA